MDLEVAGGAAEWQNPGTVLTEGQRIALRRDNLRWNQRELAKRAGVGLATITRIEKDRNVQRDTLRSVLDALDAAEAAAGGSPDLSPPAGTTEPSKEGADVAAKVHAAKVSLVRLEVFLSGALGEIRQALDDLDAFEATQASKSSRKRA